MKYVTIEWSVNYQGFFIGLHFFNREITAVALPNQIATTLKFMYDQMLKEIGVKLILRMEKHEIHIY